MVSESIQGSRVMSEETLSKEHSIEHLKLRAGGSDPFADLIRKASDPENPANCLGREDEFSGDVLPSKPKAKRLCKGCSAWDECDRYRRIARPSHGVYAGVVRGG